MSRDNWATPDNFWEWVNGIYDFNFDACAEASNARCADYYSLEHGQDSLSLPWHGRVWCNPPFSDAERWHWKAACEVTAGRCEFAAVLGHANVGMAWFQRVVKEYRPDVWLLSPRVQFKPPNGVKASSNDRDSALCVYRR
jgi:phage N-6-adenine-methyltransferase